MSIIPDPMNVVVNHDPVTTIPFTPAYPAFAVLNLDDDRFVPVLLLAAFWGGEEPEEAPKTSYLCVVPDVDGLIEHVPGEQVFFTEDTAHAFLRQLRAHTGPKPHRA